MIILYRIEVINTAEIFHGTDLPRRGFLFVPSVAPHVSRWLGLDAPGTATQWRPVDAVYGSNSRPTSILDDLR